MMSAAAPQTAEARGASVAREIKGKFDQYPALRNAALEVAVEFDRKLVIVSGLVSSEALHRHALELASSANGAFKVVDKVLVRVPRAEFTLQQAEQIRRSARAAGATVGSAITDAWIHSEIFVQLRRNPVTATQSAIQVDVVDGKVTLHGIVSSAEQKEAAGQIAENTQDVVEINNELKMVLEAGKAYNTQVA